MKIFKLVVVLLILGCYSGKQDMEATLAGDWFPLRDGAVEVPFAAMRFAADSLTVVDDYGFKEQGRYQMTQGSLRLALNRAAATTTALNIAIQYLAADTLILFDSLRYQRSHDIMMTKAEAYQLIDFATGQLFSQDAKGVQVIHYYKNDDQLQLRCGDKPASFAELPLFLESPHRQPKVLVFLGKGITLKELKRLYLHLAAAGKFKVLLGTKRMGVAATQILRDKLELWGGIVASWDVQLKIPPPPTPLSARSKQAYLASGGVEIKIDTPQDLMKIDSLSTTGNYLITINAKLSLKAYLYLKKQLQQQEKHDRKVLTIIE